MFSLDQRHFFFLEHRSRGYTWEQEKKDKFEIASGTWTSNTFCFPQAQEMSWLGKMAKLFLFYFSFSLVSFIFLDLLLQE